MNDRVKDNFRRVPSGTVSISEYMRMRNKRQHDQSEPGQYISDWQMNFNDTEINSINSDHGFCPEWSLKSASKQKEGHLVHKTHTIMMESRR